MVDKITLENMKKYLDDVLTIVLMKTDKNKIDDFVNYKSKEFLRLSQNQSKQAVYEAMRGIVLHDNMSEGSSNIMEVVGHFSSSCVPFPRQLRSILWDIAIEKVEKPRRREFNQLALASFTISCDNSLKQEVIDYHVKTASLEETPLEDEDLLFASQVLSLVQKMTKVKQSTNIPWVFTMGRMTEGLSLSEAAGRLHNLTTLCKPSKYELETIIDIVTLELDRVDLDLVRFINKYQCRISKNNCSLVRDLLKTWVKDAFIPILKENCRRLVLDQMFCHSWRLNIWKAVSLALVSLCRPWIFMSKNLEELNNVFACEPSLIYMGDFRKCIKHLLGGGSYSSLPETTNMKKTKESKQIEDPTKSMRPSQTTVEKLELEMNIAENIGTISARTLERSGNTSVLDNEGVNEESSDIDVGEILKECESNRQFTDKLKSSLDECYTKVKLLDDKLSKIESRSDTPDPRVEKLEKELKRMNKNMAKLEKRIATKPSSNTNITFTEAKSSNMEKNTSLSASAGRVANKTGKRTASSSRKSSPNGKKPADPTKIGKKSLNLSRAASSSKQSVKGEETVDSNYSISEKASRSAKTKSDDKTLSRNSQRKKAIN